MISRHRIALIGCGRIAQRHARAISEIGSAELCGVCDINLVKAAKLSTEYTVPCWPDMETMMEDARPDIVTICTPSGMHADHICAVASYGAHIICEKPLALTLEDVDRAVECCAAEGIQLCTVKQNRYNVAVQFLKQAIDDGRLGDLNFGSVRVWWKRDPQYYADWHGTWSQAGGVLANQADHHIDLLQWIMGPVVEVSAFAKYNDYTEVETGLVAILKFASGALGTVECTTLTQPVDLEGSLSVLGTNGTVVLGGFAVNEVRTWSFADDGTVNDMVGVKENPPNVYGYGHRKLYEDILSCLDEGRDWPVHWFEGRKSLEIVLAIYESVETGNPVRLARQYENVRLGR